MTDEQNRQVEFAPSVYLVLAKQNQIQNEEISNGCQSELGVPNRSRGGG